MEMLWLACGLITFLMAPVHPTEFCRQKLPEIPRATFRVLQYKIGTLVQCDCERGFRRQSSAFLKCTGNSSHTFWENTCQCGRMDIRKLITPKPGGEERKPTEMQPRDHLPGHCPEPPPWEHQNDTRIYHFVVGQEVLYHCAQGPGVPLGDSSSSVCKVSCGKIQWTQPRLACGRKDTQTPGEDVPAANSNTDITCPWTTAPTGSMDTTGTVEHVDTTTKGKTLPFSTQYQIAVASCLLLLGVFLLSGLAWQWKWRNSHHHHRGIL